MSADWKGAIDCDVHPHVPNIDALKAHMNDYWRETVEVRGITAFESVAYPPNAPITMRPDWRGDKDKGRKRADTDPGRTAAALMDRHGFAPINPFGGLRTDGEKVYVVDFGQDLGPPGARRRRGKPLLNEAKRWLAAAGHSIHPRRAEAVYAFHLDGDEGKACNEQRSS